MASRRRIVLVLITGMLVLAGVIGLMFKTEVLERQQRDVADPPSGAAPEEIVRTYTDSLDAHDCATAREVWVRDERGSADGWCDDVASLANVRIGKPFRVSPRFSGRQPGEQVVDVAVTFDLRWRPLHDDGSLDDGSTSWGYELVRDSPDDAWRIFSQGTG